MVEQMIVSCVKIRAFYDQYDKHISYQYDKHISSSWLHTKLPHQIFLEEESNICQKYVQFQNDWLRFLLKKVYKSLVFVIGHIPKTKLHKKRGVILKRAG